MNKTQAGRLLTLAWYLRKNVKPENFDLASYVSNPGISGRIGEVEVAAGLTSMEKVLEKNPKCGTTACALGHATSIWPKIFQIDPSCNQLYFERKPISAFAPEVRVFFGLDSIDCDELFYGDAVTNIDEAVAIEKLVESRGYTYAN